MVNHANNPLDNIIDIGEIADHFPVVEDGDGIAFQYPFGKFEQRHVRTAPWPVYREETQAGARQTVKMSVTMRHQFIGFLGGGIK